MKNVFKGYQVSKMAIPKQHIAKINTGFAKMHTPIVAKSVHVPKQVMAKTAKAVGKYKG